MLCDTCLGQNPYVRMTKLSGNNKLCKISHTPYQGFRWKAGPGGRYKETVISFVVAMDKNICQCCLNDMRYGLPVGVRDALLQKEDALTMPTSIVGQQYHYQGIQRELVANGHEAPKESFALTQANAAASRQLDKFSAGLLAHNASSQTAFRNLPKLCSFWLAGTCTRNNRCPFRPCCGTFVFPEIAANKEMHEALKARLAAEGAQTVQKSIDSDTRTAIQQALKGNKDEAIRKRVLGEDDLTKRYLNKLQTVTVLQPPADPSICTLWLGGLPDPIDELTLRSVLYPYGFIASLHIASASACAFVEYPDRASAEYAASQMTCLVINGKHVSVGWAKPRTQASSASATSSADNSMPAPPGMEAYPASAYALPGLPLPVKRKAVEVEDDEDEGAGPWASESAPSKPAWFSRPYANKRPAGGGGRGGGQGGAYPSMDPSRLGAKY